ncbi:MAG: hypothetical protein UD936_11245, partial [Acutalibacteraceae bacterium]|nr:hypothetical protein [Acutalibacteraceae bacterium]
VIYNNLVLVAKTAKYTVSDSVVEADRIYFIPSENWKKDNARFAVYAWNDSSKVWASLTEEDGIYSAELSDDYSNVIFCRMNPSSTENKWDNRWNQTADLKKPEDKNCFKINAGEWDGANGEWSVYIPVAPYVAVTGDVSLTLEETDDNIYTGVAELQEGLYSFNINDNGTTLGMDYTYTDTGTIDYSKGFKAPSKLIASGGRYTFTYNASTKVLRIRYKSFADIVELFGDINVELVRTSVDSTVFTGSARVEAGSYTFKINDQGTKMGFGYSFDDVVYNVEYSGAWSGATTFNATGGIYSVKYDTATNKLTFKHAPKGLGDVRIFGDINIPLAGQGNNIYSAQTVLDAGTYQFRVDSLGTTVCNGSEFTDVMNGVEYNPDWKAATTFTSTEKQKFTFIFNADTNRIKIFNAPIDTTKVLVAFEERVLILSSTDGVNYTATTALDAGTYAFRMDEFGVTLGYSGTYTDEIKGIKYNASYSSATTFNATGGEYTFSYNINTDVLKVTKA